MIVKKTWERWVKDGLYRYHDIYVGWFLFGIIPLYIERERERK